MTNYNQEKHDATKAIVETLDFTKTNRVLSQETGIPAYKIGYWRNHYRKEKASTKAPPRPYKPNAKIWKENASRQAKWQRAKRAENS